MHLSLQVFHRTAIESALGSRLTRYTLNDPRKSEARDVPRPAPATDDEIRQLTLAIAAAGMEKKAMNIEIIDVREKVDYTDYVMVMSGRSSRQVAAIARGIERELKTNHATRCLGVEGLPTANWVLMDFGDVVVHVFHDDMRGYYDLESLWMDAGRVELPEGMQESVLPSSFSYDDED